MRSYSWFGRQSAAKQGNNNGILALHTLKDNETTAKLASGVKRFQFPKEHDFIQLYKELLAENHQPNRLVEIYLNRRQFKKAADVLSANLLKSGNLKRNTAKLNDIIGDWAKFDPNHKSFPVGSQPSIGLLYRNAKSLKIMVQKVDLKAIYNDSQQYLKSNPVKLDRYGYHWNSLANQITNKNKRKYLSEVLSTTTITLKPRDQHWDTRQNISIPIKQQGAYYLTAELPNGKRFYTVLWIDSLAIVKKSVKDGLLYTVTDATTGKPAASAQLEFFGYRQVYLKKREGQRRANILTKTFTAKTNKNGQYLVSRKDLNTRSRYQWSIKASHLDKTVISAYRHNYYSYNNGGSHRNKIVFPITDRPVYQPKQKVYGKFWVRDARYDLAAVSSHAHQKFTIEITNPLGEKFGKKITAKSDKWGGISYQLDLPEDAKLGQYQVVLKQNNSWLKQHHFRVEKYKKPEFEVSVVSPKIPVQLGEKFETTIKATYYHGAPVTKATVKVKVTRQPHDARWFPYGDWDWLYGGGYGWLGAQRHFYPGWNDWGCKCPSPFWWHRSRPQPELVLERELKLSNDGSVKIQIDSALAKEIHGNQDQRYQITAEVVDDSRRTIVGNGSTLATAKPYQVTVWLNRGHATVGEKITVHTAAKTLDGKSVEAKGITTLYRVSIDKDGKINEKKVAQWPSQTNPNGVTQQHFTSPTAGQYRVESKLTDSKAREIIGASFITIRGDQQGNKENFAYNALELTPDKRSYKVGDTAKILIKTKQANSFVNLFIRSGKSHRMIQLDGQTALVEMTITQADMPNVFIDAFTVHNATIHTAVCEIIVPPAKRVLNVELVTNKEKYKPRETGSLKIKITDAKGEPVKGSVTLSIYDKALEYISGGSNVANIKTTFWKWRRHYYNNIDHTLYHYENNVVKGRAPRMRTLGIFGHMTGDMTKRDGFGSNSALAGNSRMRVKKGRSDAPMASMAMEADSVFLGGAKNNTSKPNVIIRNKFADLIKWQGNIETNEQGIAEVPVEYPDNLTTWKIKTWAMSHGTRVGEGSTEVITSKDLIIRLQAPRYFIEKDEVTLSAIVHNYSDKAVQANVRLELEGGTVKSLSPMLAKVNLGAKNGEKRINWNTKVTGEGKAIVRMIVTTADDSDAMEMTFPVYVHGILKQEAWSRVITPKQNSSKVEFNVPEQRRPEQSRLEVRYSPTIAGSLISALPYLSEFPYGCTEQTLNRFVPTVICQKLLQDLGVDLEEVRNQQANLNPQEIGNDKNRLKQWKHWKRNPVFQKSTVDKMTKVGIKRLGEMQNGDGGWGWFSGFEESSYPHTTATVVHGLLLAQKNGAKIPNNMLQRGVKWLQKYESREVKKILNYSRDPALKPRKARADNQDAFIRLVLAEAQKSNQQMLGFLFRDKKELSIYGKSLLGMSLHIAKDKKRRDAVIHNIEQFLIYDDENQTAYLNLRNSGYWYYWYGSEFEAQAWYLKLLAATKPKSKQARGLVKYLINNRKHATYWNSTRDTAYCIEAIAAYLKASGEHDPNATVEVLLDGKLYKTVVITKKNLFSYDNKFTISGDALTTGKHTVELRRKGKGALYSNTYLTVFTKEDFIKKTGLEVKVKRRYYKLTQDKNASTIVAGKHGQTVNQKTDKYTRTLLKSGDKVRSGDLIEVELIIESKNDYEYLLFEDWKPAGCENKKVRSGYINNGLHAYMEVHDEKSAFFVRQLPRGKHNLRYQLRAEIPGKFSALPTKAEAMYAPELKANSDEIKLRIYDK